MNPRPLLYESTALPLSYTGRESRFSIRGGREQFGVLIDVAEDNEVFKGVVAIEVRMVG